jgi:tyrosinase
MANINITVNGTEAAITLDIWEWTGLSINGIAVPTYTGSIPNIQFLGSGIISNSSLQFTATANKYIVIVNPDSTMLMAGTNNQSAYKLALNYSQVNGGVQLNGTITFFSQPQPGALTSPQLFSQERMTGTFQLPAYTRGNAWDANNGGQFLQADGVTPTNLYWYAKAVQYMQTLPISNPLSWWFFAAIHGEYLLSANQFPPASPNAYLNWPNITYILSSADLNSIPSTNLTTLFWDQCQHGTWYFAPWHRGYLVTLENTLRSIVTTEVTINKKNGPADWALSYWNYLNQSSTQFYENDLPPAFGQSTLPDGSANPLYVPERYGPNGDGTIYVPIGNYNVSNPNALPLCNDECQWDTIYSSSQDPLENPTNPPDMQGSNIYGDNYGGAETGFSHGNGGFGDLEMNPHNFVHTFVGGQNIINQQQGLMGVPATAALDPIFYLHHANIDRMWAAWNAYGNLNSGNSNWLQGPGTTAGNEFAMPLDANGTPWIYTPAEVTNISSINFNGAIYSYTYDDLSLTSYDTTPPQTGAAARLARLSIPGTHKILQTNSKMNTELIGANNTAITLTGPDELTTVNLDNKVWSLVSKSLTEASSNLPDQVFLQLEGVKGYTDTNFITVYVNQMLAKTVSLFGLSSASTENSIHGGSGINYKFNITHIIDSLHLKNNLDLNSLKVQIKTKNPIPKGNEITIARVAIYRSGK